MRFNLTWDPEKILPKKRVGKGPAVSLGENWQRLGQMEPEAEIQYWRKRLWFWRLMIIYWLATGEKVYVRKAAEGYWFCKDMFDLEMKRARRAKAT